MDTATVASITGAVSFTTIIVGIGVVAAAVALVHISTKGAGMLLGMIKRG